MPYPPQAEICFYAEIISILKTPLLERSKSGVLFSTHPFIPLDCPMQPQAHLPYTLGSTTPFIQKMLDSKNRSLVGMARSVLSLNGFVMNLALDPLKSSLASLAVLLSSLEKKVTRSPSACHVPLADFTTFWGGFAVVVMAMKWNVPNYLISLKSFLIL